MIARLNCVTDEAMRRAKQGRQRPGWPLSLRDSGRQAQPRDGTARPVGCQSGDSVAGASPNPANLPSSGDSE
jgi:hypothetical protein